MDKMNKRVYFPLKISPTQKEKFYNFCSDNGFDVGEVVRAFAAEFVSSHEKKDNKLPFSIDGNNKYGDEAPLRISICVNSEIKEQFRTICKKNYGLPVSVVLRGFMEYCIVKGKFPYKKMNDDFNRR